MGKGSGSSGSGYQMNYDADAPDYSGLAGSKDDSSTGGDKMAIAKKLLRGTMQGAGRGMQQDAQNTQRGGGAGQITMPAQPQVQMQDPNYLATYFQKKPLATKDNAYFYGG